MIKILIGFVIGTFIGSAYAPSFKIEDGYLYIYWNAGIGNRSKKKLFKWFL